MAEKNRRVAVNISKDFNENLVNQQIDAKNFMQLGKNSCQRKDLFFFAAALGYHRGTPTPFEGARESFVRTETFERNTQLLYGSLLYDYKIKAEPETIDEIVNDDAIYNIIEQYANKGFKILEEVINSGTTETTFMNELIEELRQLNEDFKTFSDSEQTNN